MEEKNKIEINELSKLACNGSNYTNENKQQLFDLLKSKKSRSYFLSYLNKYRSNGWFALTKNSYMVIGDILKFILDEVIIDKDYESARYCIILSQTYHYLNEFGEKISLQQMIENHELLKKRDFWENFIACKLLFKNLDSIFEEIEKQNTFTYENLETENDKNHRIINIVFSQLLPITDNMLGFQLDKNTIKEIISQFSNQYNIPTDLFQNIIKIVEEYVYEPNTFLTEKHLDQFADFAIDDDNSKNEEMHSYDGTIKDKVENENEKISTAELILSGIDNFENYYDIVDK